VHILKAVTVLFVVLAALMASTPAAADSRDIDAFSLPFFPCLNGAPVPFVAPTPGIGNDGAFSQICFVRFNGLGSWQASTGEWILFQNRLTVLPTSLDCANFAAAVTATMELNSSPVPIDKVCKQATPPSPFAGEWVMSVEFLSHPLSRGINTATLMLITPSGSLLDTENITVASST